MTHIITLIPGDGIGQEVIPAARAVLETLNLPLQFREAKAGFGVFQTYGTALPDETLAKVPARFAAESGQWVGISGRARTIVYNTEAIPDPATGLPGGLEGFTDPEWKGRLGWAPTNASFQAMVTAMRALWGDERTADWLRGIQANDPLVFDGNSPIVQAVGAGEIDAGFVNHYYLYRFLAEQGESFAARNYFLPGGGPGSQPPAAGNNARKPGHCQKQQVVYDKIQQKKHVYVNDDRQSASPPLLRFCLFDSL